MKIECWEDLENIKLTKFGNFRNTKTNETLSYMDSCETCRYPYFTSKKNPGKFCDYSCAAKDRKWSKQSRKKLSNSMKGKNNPNYKNKWTKRQKLNLSMKKKGNYKGKNNPNWKGGVKKKNIPLYDTYTHQIDWCEEVRRNPEDKNILEVKCTYCGKWYVPKIYEVQCRIKFLNGKSTGEYRFYCSDECKIECPIYKKKKYSAEESNTKQYSREVQPELRQLVFERDNWKCQKCSSEKSLHCHHVEGIRWEPLESADIDKCITYCKKCHKQVHKKEGCSYQDMKCD